MVALLLERGADIAAVENHRRTPLMFAAHRDDPSVLELLLRHGGSDIDAVDASGLSALHKACRYGSLASVQLLLEAGADPIIRTHRSGRDPYGVADFMGEGECQVPKVLELQAHHRQYLLTKARHIRDAAATTQSAQE